MPVNYSAPCPVCRGDGEHTGSPCTQCYGTGSAFPAVTHPQVVAAVKSTEDERFDAAMLEKDLRRELAGDLRALAAKIETDANPWPPSKTIARLHELADDIDD